MKYFTVVRLFHLCFTIPNLIASLGFSLDYLVLILYLYWNYSFLFLTHSVGLEHELDLLIDLNLKTNSIMATNDLDITPNDWRIVRENLVQLHCEDVSWEQASDKIPLGFVQIFVGGSCPAPQYLGFF